MKVSHQEAESRRSLYEDGGKAIGELLCTYPEKEPQIWKLVAGAGLWTRKDLAAFKSLWRRDHPVEYSRIRQARYDRKQLARRRAARLEKTREASKPQAMPTQRRPRKDLRDRK